MSLKGWRYRAPLMSAETHFILALSMLLLLVSFVSPAYGAETPTLFPLTSAQYGVGETWQLNATYNPQDPSETITYQWYFNSSMTYSAATTLTAQTNPTLSIEAATPGLGYYFCVVTATDSLSQTASSSTNIVAIIISEEQNFDGVSCGTCHYADVRREHEPYMVEPSEFGRCTGCHASIKKDWTLLTDGRLTTDLDPMIDWQDTCGTSDLGCHGQGANNGDAEYWHGLDQGRVRQAHALKIWNGSEVETATIDSSGCSSSPGSENGCHSVASTDSPFYFGALDIASAHNDYWNAVMSQATTSTPLYGLNKFSNATQAETITHGCGICHSPDNKIIYKDIANVSASNTALLCTSCHQGGIYFDGDYASIETSKCASFEINGEAQLESEPSGIQSESLSTSIIQLLSSAVDSVKQLFEGIFGSDEPALSAGTVEPLPQELPLQHFPTGSLLNPEAPFKVTK